MLAMEEEVVQCRVHSIRRHGNVVRSILYLLVQVSWLIKRFGWRVAGYFVFIYYLWNHIQAETIVASYTFQSSTSHIGALSCQ